MMAFGLDDLSWLVAVITLSVGVTALILYMLGFFSERQTRKKYR